MRGGRRQDLDRTVKRGPGACSTANILYVCLLNGLEMHLKLPCAMKLVYIYTLQMNQISKAEAILAQISGIKLVITLQDKN